MGKAVEEHDAAGRRKVKCLECGLYFHRLDVHLGSAHSMNVSQYISLHPGAEVMSEYARERGGVGADAVANLMKRAEGKSDDQVLEFGAARLKVRAKLNEDDAAWVPLHDEKWVVNATEATALEALALGIQMDKNVLIVGPPGVGKTSLVRELAAITNNPLRMMPIMGDMRVSDFLGSKDLVVDDKSGQTITHWSNGVYVEAAEKGHWLCANEIDSIPEQVAFVLLPGLERPRNMMVLGRTKNPNVNFHKRHRFIATANTLGYGDDTGLYAGRKPMDAALLDRFDITIRMGYPTRAQEADMLVERTGIDANSAGKMVDLATEVRQAQERQAVVSAVSMRRLIAWAELTVQMRKAVPAARLVVSNKLPPDDAKFVDGLIQRFFGKNG